MTPQEQEVLREAVAMGAVGPNVTLEQAFNCLRWAEIELGPILPSGEAFEPGPENYKRASEYARLAADLLQSLGYRP